jgi:alanyl-tRNA synthetase
VTARLYRDDPYRLEFDALVVGRAEHEGRPAVILDRTAFYAESGGQPWDTGTLEAAGTSADVVAVIERGAEVLHVVGGGAAPAVGQRVQGRVDGPRRLDHRQQHHGQHLLSRAFVEIAGAETISFHLGAREVSIDLDREVTAAQVAGAVRRANDVVWEGREVSVRTVSRAEARAQGVEVPEQAGDEVRIVHAEGFDLQACGGTHPRRTSEVGLVLGLGHERYKGGSRVRFACGHRALARAEEHYAALREAGSVLSAAPEAVPGLVARALEQAAEAGRHVKALQEQIAGVERQRLVDQARSAAPGTVPVLTRVFEGWDAAQVRQLAVRLTDEVPCVALLATRGESAQLFFTRSEALTHDVAAALQAVLGELGGRGGGRGRMAQGGCDGSARLEEALERAAQRLRGALPA